MMTTCPSCSATETDTIAAAANPDRAAMCIPARVFCASCGLFLGFEGEPPPIPVCDVPLPDYGAVQYSGFGLFPIVGALWSGLTGRKTA